MKKALDECQKAVCCGLISKQRSTEQFPCFAIEFLRTVEFHEPITHRTGSKNIGSPRLRLPGRSAELATPLA